jgi:mannitol/fructose-specific phosphotransferase system IIA component (Ntr-type)
MQTETHDYWKLFKASACNLRLKGETREELFGEMVSTLVKAKVLSAELAKDAEAALLAREKLASTGVGQNVAIPHVKLAGIDRAVVSLSILPRGVDWAAVDGEPVHIFFLVLRPADATVDHDPERHLEMMRWIAQMARDADFRRFAQAVSTRTELVELLKEMAAL